jgi:hypothetical protein
MKTYREMFKYCKHNGTAMLGHLGEIKTAFNGVICGKLYTCGLTKHPCTSKECPKLANAEAKNLKNQQEKNETQKNKTNT